MPRIEPVNPENASGEIKHIYEELKKTKWRVPTMYQVLAHHPNILKAHEAYFDAVMNRGVLDRKLKEKIAFKVAQLNDCAYSTASHRRYAIKCGATEEEMEAVEKMQTGSMEARESSALQLAVAMNHAGRDVTPQLFEKLRESFSSTEIVELLATVGLMVLACRFADALGLAPDT